MPGVIAGDENMHAEIAATLERRLPVTGHWSLSGQRDHRLQAYIAAGVDSCHETTTREDALAKLRAGMWVQFREGSTFRDVAALAPVLTEDGVDPRHCLLVTDDVLPDTVVADGHMDRVVRRAIEEGIDPLVAIQMATVNGAEYFGMRHDLGSIAPGRLADILFVEDLRDFRPHRVLVDGREPGELPGYEYPPEAYESIRLARPLTAADLKIEASGERVRVRAIGVASGTVTTEHVVLEVPVADGEVRASAELDLAKAASIERHGGPGTIGLGLVTGLGLQRGAVGSTVAHDNHNVLVAGMSDTDMILAVERLVGGGRRDDRRRRRRGAGAGRVADRGPDQRPAGRRGRRADTRALGGLPAARLADREPRDDLLVPLARGDPGAAADESRAGRQRRVRARPTPRMSVATSARRFCCGLGMRPFCIRSIARRWARLTGCWSTRALLPGGFHPGLPLVGAECAERLLRPHRILVGPGPLQLLHRAAQFRVVAIVRVREVQQAGDREVRWVECRRPRS